MAGSYKYKILNFILFPLVLSIAVMNYETWSRSSISAEAVAQPAAGPANPSQKAATAAAGGEAKPVQPAEAYGIIAEKNIFSPERKDFPRPSALLPLPNCQNRPFAPRFSCRGSSSLMTTKPPPSPAPAAFSGKARGRP